jgi:hypothetical protein
MAVELPLLLLLLSPALCLLQCISEHLLQVSVSEWLEW